MKDNRPIKQQGIRMIIMVITLFTIIHSAVAAFGHGGKHAKGFTHLQALQKATQLYDQLVNSGKLDPSWETDLVEVGISNRQKGNKKEVMVEFHRHEGKPQAVYIFFNADGKYVGSNFTGE